MFKTIKNFLFKNPDKQDLCHIHNNIKQKSLLIKEQTTILEKEIILGYQFLNLITEDEVKRHSSYMLIPKIQNEINTQEKIIDNLQNSNLTLGMLVEAVNPANEIEHQLKIETNGLINLQNNYIEKSINRNHLLINTIDKIMYNPEDELTNYTYN